MLNFLKVNMGIALLFISMICKAQNFEKTLLGVKASIKSIETKIQFFNSATIRLIKYPTGKEFSKQSLSVMVFYLNSGHGVPGDSDLNKYNQDVISFINKYKE